MNFPQETKVFQRPCRSLLLGEKARKTTKNARIFRLFQTPKFLDKKGKHSKNKEKGNPQKNKEKKIRVLLPPE